jgi:hypothetical protein
MISGIISTPSSIEFPKNVRIIGAINIDETTHYLSPKILDRAHIMKFDSPLLYDWTIISSEIEENVKSDNIVKFNVDELGVRKKYPSYDKDNDFCNLITSFTKNYFQPLGIEVGLRTIRQGLNYRKILIDQESDENVFLDNFIIHKLLPKITFDGSEKNEKGISKLDFLENFISELENLQHNQQNLKLSCINTLNNLINKSKENESIINYWA